MRNREQTLHFCIRQYLEIASRTVNNRIGFWTYLPFGENRTLTTGALLKKKGTKRGVPDFLMILNRDGFSKNRDGFSEFLWIEAKVGKNGQTDEQREFERRCEQTSNEHYLLLRDNIDELASYLNKNIG
ncbi:hypothetical protein FACS1894152_4190 [Bacilli bacterium]|nr:hypothetical protein FACS1894152_4190 [Bacilli bacterium]